MGGTVLIGDPDTGRPISTQKWAWETDPWVRMAIDEIQRDYSITAYPKGKSLLKFGESEDIDQAFETVWEQGGDETYATTNAIDKISSSSGSDTQEVKIEYHTIDGSGNFTFGVQTVTLAGQTEKAIPTPCARVSRVYNNSGSNFAGDIYVYEDDTVIAGVPQTASKIHAKIQQSLAGNSTAKAATTISSVDYWALTSFYASVGQKTAATVDLRIEVALKDKVFREKLTIACAQGGGPIQIDFRPFVIVPANTDIRVRAKSSAVNTEVEAALNGILLKDSSS